MIREPLPPEYCIVVVNEALQRLILGGVHVYPLPRIVKFSVPVSKSSYQVLGHVDFIHHIRRTYV